MDIEEKYKQLLSNAVNIIERDKFEQQLRTIAQASGKPLSQVEDDFHEVLFEKVKADAASIIKIENPIMQAKKKKRLIDFIFNHVGDKKEAENAYKYAINLLEQPELKTLAQINEELKHEKYEWIISEILPLGVFLFMGGGAKVGKTTFSSYLLLCLVTGKSFINRAVKPCNVLFISNEEPKRMTRDRFYAGLRDVENDDPELWKEIVETGRLKIATGLDIVINRKQIFDQAQSFGAKVIIIDSLRQSCYISEQDKEIIPALYMFAKECHMRNISVIILHHATKNNVSSTSKEKNDVDAIMNSIGGLSGIQGTHDGIIVLRRIKDNQNALVINFIPRFTSGFEVTVERKVGVANTWSFEVIDEKSLTEYERQLQIDILQCLHDRYTQWEEESNAQVELGNEPLPIYGYTVNELMALCDATRTDVIHRTNYMLQNNAICVYTSNREFVFHIPEGGESWLDILIEQQEAVEEFDADIINRLLHCTSYDQVVQIYRDVSGRDKRRIQSKLTDEQKVHVWGLRYPPRYKVGDNVIVLDAEQVEHEHTVQALRFEPAREGENERGERIELPYKWFYIVDIANNVYYEEDQIIN